MILLQKIRESAPDPVGAREFRYAIAMVFVPAGDAAAALVQAAWLGVGWLEVALLLAMYLLSGFGVEAGLRRFFSHRAFRAGPIMTVLFGVAGSMAAQGPILFWASVHRRHHAYTDRQGDPHSPHCTARAGVTGCAVSGTPMSVGCGSVALSNFDQKKANEINDDSELKTLNATEPLICPHI